MAPYTLNRSFPPTFLQPSMSKPILTSWTTTDSSIFTAGLASCSAGNSSSPGWRPWPRSAVRSSSSGTSNETSRRLALIISKERKPLLKREDGRPCLYTRISVSHMKKTTKSNKLFTVFVKQFSAPVYQLLMSPVIWSTWSYKSWKKAK